MSQPLPFPRVSSQLALAKAVPQKNIPATRSTVATLTPFQQEFVNNGPNMLEWAPSGMALTGLLKK
jgi:hypothetical protein